MLAFIRLWKQKQYLRDIAFLKKKGQWGINSTTLRFLLEQFQKTDNQHFKVPQLRQLVVHTRTRSIDELILCVQRANLALRELDFITDEEASALPLEMRHLDAYWISVHQTALDFAEVKKQLVSDLTVLLDDYDLLESNVDPKKAYYQRRLNWLFADIYVVLTVLNAAVPSVD